MDKKTIVGVLLMSFIFVGYVIYSSKQQAKYQEYLAEVAAQEAAAVEAAEPAVEAEATIAQADTTAVVDRNVEIFGATLAAARDREAQTVTMQNDYLSVEFSTQGASMHKVTMAEYTKYAPREERNENVVLYEPAASHMALEFFIRKDLNNVPVNTSEYVFENMGVTRGEGFQKLAMRLEVAPESYLVYEYVLYDDKTPSRDYLLDFDIKLVNMAQLMTNQSELNLLWTARTYQNERGYQNENLYTTVSYRLPGEESIESLATGKDQVQEAVQNPVNWVAFKQQFFSEALIARNNFSFADVMYVTEQEGSGYIKTFTARMGLPYDAQTTQYDMSVYCGPNKYAVLSNVIDEEGNKIAMERLIPLGGWLVGWINRWIVIPVFDFLSKYIGSFGLIILILTVLIKLLILPLTYRSYLSTAKMRVIKPEVDALNEKYPRQEDAMKKQQAMMDLYKKAGINPLGGCLPLLIQLPILWAMFRFFPASIELRGESFLWADDLSAYDSIVSLPFNIPWYGDHVSLFALLMCAALVGFSYFSYQQTASSQPQMAGMRFMMVYLMPIMMLFFFNGYASGLCYYYLLSQLITIGIMAGIRRFVDDEKIHAMIRRNAEKQKNKKKSKFQLRYEEIMRQQQEQLREQERRKGRR